MANWQYKILYYYPNTLHLHSADYRQLRGCITFKINFELCKIKVDLTLFPGFVELYQYYEAKKRFLIFIEENNLKEIYEYFYTYILGFFFIFTLKQ